MAHANAVIYALYNLLPFRNFIYASPFVNADEQSEEHSSVLSFLQLMFSKIYGGGPVNPVYLLENSYLATEGFEASPIQLPRFVDPNLFYAWSVGRLAEAIPEVKDMFHWSVEVSSQFTDATLPHMVSERETASFEIDLGSVKDVCSLQEHLNSLLINGAKSYVVQQGDDQGPKERAIIQRTKFLSLPRILTFRLIDVASSPRIDHHLKLWQPPQVFLTVDQSLNIEGQTFNLYAAVCPIPDSGKFLTFVNVGADWLQFQSDTPPIKVSFEDVQEQSANAYMLLYAQPEFMASTTATEPPVDLSNVIWVS